MHKVDPSEINKHTRPELGYEPRDIDVGPIFKYSTLFFVATTIAIFLVVPFYLWFLNLDGGAPGHQTIALAVPKAPNPLIQSSTSAKLEIVELRTKEKAALNSYGWVDKSKGIAHIPITRAIALTAQRGVNGPQGASNP